ncbi:MAG: hypothetical protein ACM65L_20135 [Microcoleus sp.]
MSTYRKLAKLCQRSAIALLAFFLWVIPVASSLAAPNNIAPGIVNSATAPFSAENIALRQLDLAESANLLAFFDYSEQGLSYYQQFQEALLQPNKKQNLFGVCEKSGNKGECFNFLANYLQESEVNFVRDCYRPGVNGRLCLSLALRSLEIRDLSELRRWINEAQDLASL